MQFMDLYLHSDFFEPNAGPLPSQYRRKICLSFTSLSLSYERTDSLENESNSKYIFKLFYVCKNKAEVTLT